MRSLTLPAHASLATLANAIRNLSGHNVAPSDPALFHAGVDAVARPGRPVPVAPSVTLTYDPSADRDHAYTIATDRPATRPVAPSPRPSVAPVDPVAYFADRAPFGPTALPASVAPSAIGRPVPTHPDDVTRYAGNYSPGRIIAREPIAFDREWIANTSRRLAISPRSVAPHAFMDAYAS